MLNFPPSRKPERRVCGEPRRNALAHRCDRITRQPLSACSVDQVNARAPSSAVRAARTMEQRRTQPVGHCLGTDELWTVLCAP